MMGEGLAVFVVAPLVVGKGAGEVQHEIGVSGWHSCCCWSPATTAGMGVAPVASITEFAMTLPVIGTADAATTVAISGDDDDGHEVLKLLLLLLSLIEGGAR